MSSMSKINMAQTQKQNLLLGSLWACLKGASAQRRLWSHRT